MANSDVKKEKLNCTASSVADSIVDAISFIRSSSSCGQISVPKSCPVWLRPGHIWYIPNSKADQTRLLYRLNYLARPVHFLAQQNMVRLSNLISEPGPLIFRPTPAESGLSDQLIVQAHYSHSLPGLCTGLHQVSKLHIFIIKKP